MLFLHAFERAGLRRRFVHAVEAAISVGDVAFPGLRGTARGYQRAERADEKQDRVTELFDKYNLLALPVVDEQRKLTGVITADDIISVLRQR